MSVKSIKVYTKNKYLFQKIRRDAGSILVDYGISEGALLCEDEIVLWDNSMGSCPISGAITLGGEGADILLPFPLGTVSALIQKNGESTLGIDTKNKAAILHGARIRLTDVEFSLFSSLYEKRGEYVTREDLISSVWGDGIDGGILNVYIHYLREKLEGDGEKIILSSRKLGYCIDKRFLGGKD